MDLEFIGRMQTSELHVKAHLRPKQGLRILKHVSCAMSLTVPKKPLPSPQGPSRPGWVELFRRRSLLDVVTSN